MSGKGSRKMYIPVYDQYCPLATRPVGTLRIVSLAQERVARVLTVPTLHMQLFSSFGELSD
jgi:hypothetical protein